MRTEERILFACFTGAALGGVVALQLHYLWWIGLLLGGATGYLAYSFREVFRAGVQAWRTLTGGQFDWRTLTAGIWNAARVTGIMVCVVFCAASVLALSAGTLMLLVSEPSASVGTRAQTVLQSAPNPLLFWTFLSAGVLLPIIVLCIVLLRSNDKKRTVMAMMGCLAATPLLLPISLAAIFIWTVLPRLGKLLVRLASHTFILVHSELRLLCMTDALLGSLVGYACGNALMGGVAGAALGWVNYRFVSVKWLKLVKA